MVPIRTLFYMTPSPRRYARQVSHGANFVDPNAQPSSRVSMPPRYTPVLPSLLENSTSVSPPKQ
ncbi:hypothetical protein C8Q76DRAFT_708793 [Earliella scabrosa]|nr:hypothetical protein C8Q76DRAFT_708793 [Earliella scabrosa]